jgi:hypothetical protein
MIRRRDQRYIEIFHLEQLAMIREMMRNAVLPGELVALAGIHHFLRPLLGLLEFSLEQIEPRQSIPRSRRLRRGLEQTRLGVRVFLLQQINLAESIQRRWMVRLQ